MMKRNYREVKDNPALGYITQMSATSEEEKKEATEPQSLEAVLQEASSIEITPRDCTMKCVKGKSTGG